MSRPARITDVDLTAPSITGDPYAEYARLLTQEPIHWSEKAQGWFVVGHKEILALVHDRRMSSRLFSAFDLFPRSFRAKVAPLLRNFENWCVLMDPPGHTRLRGLLNKAFTPRLISKLTLDIDVGVNHFLNQALREKGPQLDIIKDFAHPLPLFVLGKMLGIHEGDDELLRVWSDDIANFFGLRHINQELVARALASLEASNSYFSAILAERRRQPRNDLLSSFVAAEREGLAEEPELLAMCTLLIFAGHETTTNMIGNSMLALLQRPELATRLTHDAALFPRAVEELLRYESPLPRITRVALEDVEIGGVRIPQGDRLYMIVGAANRDPAVFARPDELIIDRPENNKHIAFGHGRHFCSGAALARLEGGIALRTLLRRLPGIHRLGDKVEWQDSFMLRGLKSLPVAFDPDAIY